MGLAHMWQGNTGEAVRRFGQSIVAAESGSDQVVRDKLSRALLDRVDLVVTVPRPRAVELAAGPAEASAPVRERVAAGRARLGGPLLRRTAAADELLSRAVERLPLSGRGRARVARVARTAAALAGAEGVLPEHVAEALAYRSPKELAA